MKPIPGNTKRHGLIRGLIVPTILVVGLVAAFSGTVRGDPKCTCRYASQSYALGTCLCIATPNGSRRACCDQVLNNTSWTFSDGTCLMVGAPDPLSAQNIAGLSRPAVQDKDWESDLTGSLGASVSVGPALPLVKSALATGISF